MCEISKPTPYTLIGHIKIPSKGTFQGHPYASIMVLRTIGMYISNCPIRGESGLRHKNQTETWKYANMTRQVLQVIQTLAIEEPEKNFLHFEIPNMGQFLVVKFLF